MAITVELRRGEATRVVSTLSDFEAIIKDEKLRSDIAEIRRLQAVGAQKKAIGKDAESAAAFKEAGKIKSALPGFIFQCKDFEIHNWTDKNGTDHGDAAWRHQKYGVLNGLFMVDYDHIDDPRQLWIDIQKKGLMDKWQILLAFITSSAKGLKIVAVADEKMGNLSQNQVAFSDMAGAKCDESCKDSSRLSFAPGFDDVLFLDGNLCSAENEEFARKWQGKYADGSADQNLFQPEKKNEKKKSNSQTEGDRFDSMTQEWERMIANGEELPKDDACENRLYDGVKVWDFIHAYLGEEPVKEGMRHDTILDLASNLRYVLENSLEDIAYFIYRLPFAQELVRIGRDVRETIRDGYGYKYYKGGTKKVKGVLSELIASNKAASGEEMEKIVFARMTAFGEEIQKLFKVYPCLKECCGSFLPASYPAMTFVGGALFGTLATRTWYSFYHDPEKERRLNYAVFIIADPASSKSSIGSLFEKILAPVLAQDEVYDNQVNAYKRATKDFDYKTKKDRDKTEVSYPVTKTRVHGTRTANNVFIEALFNNVEEVDGRQMHLHLFTFDSELDSATAASKGGQWIDKSMFELKAFHNETDDQYYRNKDAVTGKFNVYWNYIYTGTPFSLEKKVNQRNFGSGLSSRLAVLPLLNESYKMIPRMRKTKQLTKQTELLEEWAYKMDKVSGELPIDPLVDEAYDWTAAVMEHAKLSNSKVIEYLCKRVAYYGLNVAVPFIIMRHWDSWEKDKSLPIDQTDKDFVTLIMDIQYFTQRLYFGRYAENYFKERQADYNETAISSERTELQAALAKLPNQFTRKDIEEALKMSRPTANRIIVKMLQENLIKEQERKRSTKTTYIKTSHDKKE